mgnify:CR=1 FL=1
MLNKVMLVRMDVLLSVVTELIMILVALYIMAEILDW